MNHTENHLSRLTDPTEVLFSITMQQVISQIALRMGAESLNLTAEDLNVLQSEIVDAMNQMLDYRDAVDEGISAFKVIRTL